MNLEAVQFEESGWNTKPQIVAVLRQVESGLAVPELYREHRRSPPATLSCGASAHRAKQGDQPVSQHPRMCGFAGILRKHYSGTDTQSHNDRNDFFGF